MAKKYIDADKLIEEIERRIEETKSMKPSFDQFWAGQISAFKGVITIIASIQQERLEIDLEKYIRDKLRELGADLINHKPYSFNRGLNVGETNAYEDILKKFYARKEE